MNDNDFFKPTPLYKEFMILDLIEKEDKITQRMMSNHLGVAVSMVNSYLDKYEEAGYIKRKYVNSKTVFYLITKKGIEQKRVLNIQYLKASSLIYNGAKKNITVFLTQIIYKGFRKILLYGAGEVAEILLQTIDSDKTISLVVVAVIDDNKEKVGNKFSNIDVISVNDLILYPHDGILISSYINSQKIYNKLVDIHYDKKKILSFFDR